MTAIAEYDGIRVIVGSDDARASAWLREFLHPSFTFEESGADSADWPRVDLVADDDAYEAEHGKSPGAGEEADCFRADGPTLRLALRSESASGRVFFDRRHRAFYRMDAQGRHGRVIGGRGDLATRFAWMRLVRERVIAGLLSRGDVVLHGAALATEVGGLVIAGDKAAGKTTLLFNALRQGGASFITNDRAVLHRVGENVIVRGMPTVVSLRAPTLADHPDATKRLQGSGWDHRLALGEKPGLGARCAFPRAGESVDLSPAQFAALLDVPMVARCALRAIAFIERSSGEGGIAVRRLAPDEAAARFSSATLFGEGRNQSVLAPATPNVAGAATLVGAIRREVPMFEWLVGDGAHLKALAPTIEDTLRAGRPA